MKTKCLFVAALTMLVCASCQKERSDCAGQQPGLDTYAGMTISLPKELVESRALVDGTAEESKINSIKVGTWSDGNNAITTYTTLAGSDFTPDGSGNYTATKAIKAKTGKTNFIVIANSAEELTISQVNGEAFPKTVANIATANNFVMYSREIMSLQNVQMASKEEVENAPSSSPLYTTNRTSVTLRRAAAKVSVTSSLNATDGTGVLDALNNGKLYDIQWNIANQNSLMTAIVNKLDKLGDFVVKNVNSPFSKLPNEVPTLIIPKTGIVANSAYCLENSNGLDVYTEKNTTAVHVTAVFAPAAGKYFADVTGAAGALVPTFALTDMGKGTTFYVSKNTYGTIAAGTFFNLTAANAVKNIFGESDLSGFTEYIGGVCHWPVYIHDGAKPTPNYGVLRNHIYEMNIKSIKAPGFSVFPETDTPISANAYIQVDLSVKEWTNSNMGGVEM